MLVELSIRNLALIEELRLRLEPGFTVLTGETGAGKSIIIDALSVALGDRADSALVRTGCEEGEVEAVFEASGSAAAIAVLAEAGVEPEEGLIILRRLLSAAGRSRCYLNGRAATLSALRAVGNALVDIHGQHEHQTLIHEATHLEFLDTFAGAEHLERRREFARAMAERASARAALSRHLAEERERHQRLDLLRFQVEELRSAALEPDEDVALEAERRVLANAEALRLGALAAHEALDGEAEGAASTLVALQTAQERLGQLTHLDPTLREAAEAVARAAYEAEDAARQLSAYVERLEADPRRLEQLDDRLDLIRRLKRKYGDSVADILRVGEEAAREIEVFEHFEERQAALEEDLRRLEATTAGLAEQLSATRRQAARHLQKAVAREVRPLGMEAATVAVMLERTPNADGLPLSDGATYTADSRGVDQCRFELSTNRGEPAKALSKVASGGELSRFMLALKSMCSRSAEIQTIIFDEVDVGIGGRTAHAVGRKLADLAGRAQVLCVTHLPQIARLADQQVRVAKREARGRTLIEARTLGEEERVAELVRMLGADTEDGAALEHAAELLRSGAEERQGARKASVAR